MVLDLGSDEGYKSKQFLPPDPSSFHTPPPPPTPHPSPLHLWATSFYCFSFINRKWRGILWSLDQIQWKRQWVSNLATVELISTNLFPFVTHCFWEQTEKWFPPSFSNSFETDFSFEVDGKHQRGLWKITEGIGNLWYSKSTTIVKLGIFFYFAFLLS